MNCCTEEELLAVAGTIWLTIFTEDDLSGKLYLIIMKNFHFLTLPYFFLVGRGIFVVVFPLCFLSKFLAHSRTISCEEVACY